MLNWQGWAATNFQGWGSAGAATPVVTPQEVGGGGGKRRLPRNYWTIRGKTYLIEDEDVPALVQAILAKDKAQKLKPSLKRAAQQIRAAVAETPPVSAPTFAALPAFDALWAELMSTEQHRQAQMARQIAHDMEIEQDDADIFALLQLIDD
jgi:hypothetical protein